MYKGGERLLYENIISLCKARKISVARLEREIGVGNATIRNWKSSSPSVDKVEAVADYFGVTVDSLLKGMLDLSTQ